MSRICSLARYINRVYLIRCRIEYIIFNVIDATVDGDIFYSRYCIIFSEYEFTDRAVSCKIVKLEARSYFTVFSEVEYTVLSYNLSVLILDLTLKASVRIEVLISQIY